MGSEHEDRRRVYVNSRGKLPFIDGIMTFREKYGTDNANSLTGVTNAEYHCSKVEDALDVVDTLANTDSLVAVLDPPRYLHLSIRIHTSYT